MVKIPVGIKLLQHSLSSETPSLIAAVFNNNISVSAAHM